ncbi:cold shock domain-containing protein [Streptomyces virginiae]|uniref:cold shock domain-containing protein n=1 Tax=Streptomyces virginiae TaxID=1961 RepID=UPI0036BDF393
MPGIGPPSARSRACGSNRGVTALGHARCPARGVIRRSGRCRGEGVRVHRAGRWGGPDLFVHYAEIQGNGYKSRDEGRRVEFELGEGTKGPQATQVRAL